MNLCEMCKKKSPSCLVNDHDGLEHQVCQKCQPVLTLNAVLSELEVIKKHLERKLYQYELYRVKHTGPEIYRASRSFQEDFEKMIVRLQQLTSIKHYGRQPKNKLGIIDNNYTIPTPPKRKPTPKPTIKPKSKLKQPPKAKNNKHKVKDSKKPNDKSTGSKTTKTNHQTK